MAAEPTPPGEGLLVIHVALYRMATRSSAEAYRILGYKTHHGLDDVLGSPWVLFEQAAEATWPDAPKARPRARFTRADWDQLWGKEFDIATDMSSPFADQLIEAYPEAKVVVVQRDFDKWWPSYKSEMLDTLFPLKQRIILFFVTNLLGLRAGPAMEKVHFGFFGAKNLDEIEANARKAYDAYYKRIRDMVPPERRLEYKMGDGWEPLCSFLGKPVPDVPFPRLNDRQAHSQGTEERRVIVFKNIFKKILPVVGAALAVGLAWRLYGS
ncbi:unnamed protein product [Clonostachys byssicola]|uniref:Efflux pump antibiotic resistance protein n=1 Tax=Clonostachys byssicola TaxID=160290 RepID=A0A9N9UQ88_9HYPO|nr:unnamed protein product [Clonostachys byssicola]